ncbi:MAG: proprotein convertase P-domain-containing protein [Lentisphaeria bacterium]|nr:proprotein convertase P-domain-containing protein [Lentisphaeria bacterium]
MMRWTLPCFFLAFMALPAAAVDGISVTVHWTGEDAMFYGGFGEIYRHQIQDNVVVERIKIHDGPARMVVLNPSGTRVAFLKESGTISVMSIDGGTELDIATAHPESALDWPHDDWIYFNLGGWPQYETSRYLYRVNIISGEEELVTIWDCGIWRFGVSADLTRAVARATSGCPSAGTIVAYDLLTNDGILDPARATDSPSCGSALGPQGAYFIDGKPDHSGVDIRRWDTLEIVDTIIHSEAEAWGGMASGANHNRNGWATNAQEWFLLHLGWEAHHGSTCRGANQVMYNWVDQERIVVTDNLEGSYAFDSAGDFWVGRLNDPPWVEAGPNAMIALGGSLRLQGEVVDDGEPTGELVVAWSQLDGPGTATFSTPDQAGTEVDFDALGDYRLQLMADDGEYRVLDELVVQVLANGPPLIDAGVDLTILFGDVAHLKARVEDDGLPYGALSLTWSQLDGPAPVVFQAPSSSDTSASFGLVGNYGLRLQASDGEHVVVDDLTVSVVLNEAPWVDAGEDRTLPPSTAISLIGNVDDDGFPFGELQLHWATVSGPGPVVFSTTNQAETEAEFLIFGEYVLRLSVSDSALAAFDDLTVTVAENSSPVVEAGNDQTIPLGSPALLVGEVRDDGLPVGQVELTWTQLSGPGTATFQSPQAARTLVTFDALGSYALRLSADDGALQSHDDVTVEIIPRASISLISPNGGEAWVVGDIEHIVWSAEGISDVTLFLSTDGGETWEMLVQTVDIDSPRWGDQAIIVPDQPSSNCLIAIAAYLDGNGRVVSDAPFTIAEPQVPDSSPGGGCAQAGGAPFGFTGVWLLAGLLLLGQFRWRRRRTNRSAMRGAALFLLACLAAGVTSCGGETTSDPVCGNGLVEAPERCDGTDLGGQTCSDHGFSAGQLGCTPTCDAFVLSGCTDRAICGNKRLEEGEVCDGSDLGGTACADLGYAGGSLGCVPGCDRFDESGCTFEPDCGNGVIEFPEVCDGQNLAGNDCIAFGFTTGEIGCAEPCDAFDVSGCVLGPICANDLDCSCHRHCLAGTCVPLGANSPGFAMHAHGNWEGIPGQPNYRYLDTCEVDADCGGDERCNPFTGGCLPAAQVSISCQATACPAITACDPLSLLCFPVGLCVSEQQCCGFQVPGCTSSDGLEPGLCFEKTCSPPDPIIEVCPLEPRLEEECPAEGSFCSPAGRCVACGCDAECADPKPRCDVISGACVDFDFCRDGANCLEPDSACDRNIQRCAPRCAWDFDCGQGEFCDPLDRVCRCAPDEHEPNDQQSDSGLPALPYPVLGGESRIEGTLCPGDVDWFVLALAEGDRVLLDGAGMPGLLATMALYAPDGTSQLATGFIDGETSPPLDSTASADGVYYLQLFASLGEGHYAIRIRHPHQEECDLGGDNDSPENALPLNPLSGVALGCDVASGDLAANHAVTCLDSMRLCEGDVDFYRIHAHAAARVTASVRGFSEADLDLGLFGPFWVGESLDMSRLVDGSSTGQGEETVSATSRSESYFLLRVFAFFGGHSNYDLELQVSDAAPDPDCDEDVFDAWSGIPEPLDAPGFNDDPSTASGIELDPTAAVVLDLSLCRGDQDWFTLGHVDTGNLVGAAVGNRVRARVENVSPGPAEAVRLLMGHDPMLLLAEAGAGGGGQESMEISLGLPIYLLALARTGADGPQYFSLRLTEEEPPPCDLDDLGDLTTLNRNDSPATATLLPSPPWPTLLSDPQHSFPENAAQILSLCADDQDWYRIDDPADILRVTLEYDHSLGEAGIALYDQSLLTRGDGSPPSQGLLDLSEVDGVGLQTVIGAPEGGPAYILVYNRSGWPLDYRLTLAISSVASFTDTAEADIPDANTTSSGCGHPGSLSRVISVPVFGYVTDVDLELNIRHSYDQDLEIFLGYDNHGQSFCVELSTNNGGSGDNYTQTLFDDSAEQSITDGNPPFSGRYRPESPLAVLLNARTDGDWVLFVNDSYAVDVGVLESWTLTLERRSEPSPPTPP